MVGPKDRQVNQKNTNQRSSKVVRTRVAKIRRIVDSGNGNTPRKPAILSKKRLNS